MDIPALRAARQYVLGPDSQLDQLGARAVLDQVDEGLDTEYVVQVDRERVVGVLHCDEPGKREHAPQLLCGAETLAAAAHRQSRDFLARNPPARRGEDEPAVHQPRQEPTRTPGAPVPLEVSLHPLMLDAFEELVQSEAGRADVVGVGHPRKDLAPEPARPQNHPAAADRHQEIGHRNLELGRDRRATQVGDLVLPEHRPGDHVASPSRRQMDDLRKHGIRAKRLLPSEILPHLRAQLLVEVTESSEHLHARRSTRVLEAKAVVSRGHRLLGGGVERAEDGEYVGERGAGSRRQILQIRVPYSDLVQSEAERLLVLPDCEHLRRRPWHGGGRAPGEGQADQKGGRLGRGGCGLLEADPDLLVQDLAQRDLLSLVPLQEVALEGGPRIAALSVLQTMEESDPAQDLVDHRHPDRGVSCGLEEVHLNEPCRVDLDRKRLQGFGNRAVGGATVRPAACIDLLEGGMCLLQPLGSRLPAPRLQQLDHPMDRFRTRHRREHPRDQDLSVNELGDEPLGFGHRDLRVDQRLRELADRRAGPGTLQRGGQVGAVLDPHQP